MNNKEFINELSARADIPAKETQKAVAAFAGVLADALEEGDSLAVQGFGSFEVKKKLERVVVNPTTKQRQLIPPKLSISFKPGAALKEKTT